MQPHVTDHVTNKISRYQGVLNEVSAAVHHWKAAMGLLGHMFTDMQRGLEYMEKHQDWLTNAIAEAEPRTDGQVQPKSLVNLETLEEALKPTEAA